MHRPVWLVLATGLGRRPESGLRQRRHVGNDRRRLVPHSRAWLASFLGFNAGPDGGLCTGMRLPHEREDA